MLFLKFQGINVRYQPATHVLQMAYKFRIAKHLRAYLLLGEGAELIQGGVQTGANVAPTILLQPNRASKVVCQEVFGPIVSVIPIKSFEEGIAEANNSDFGLQVGVFTNNFQLIQQAIQQLEAGGVIINGTSNFRLDHLPYGGIKNSGIGREGPRFAIHEMTEMKMVVIRN